MTQTHDSGPGPRALARRAIGFAREHLGPASEAVLQGAPVQTVVLARLRDGADLEDAVLGEVFRAGGSDRRVADEFLGHFLPMIMDQGHTSLSRGLRRFLDTGDLVQSVLGDLWPELFELRFETRAQFLSLLAQRLQWKASNTARRMGRKRRREDLRVEAPTEQLELQEPSRSPLSEVGSSEEHDRLILALMKLSERDRTILRMHLAAEPLEEIARETGLSPESARKALQRAVRRAREVIR